ncbi:MAG: penicillin acylase family protein [Pseudomonadota bacterium]
MNNSCVLNRVSKVVFFAALFFLAGCPSNPTQQTFSRDVRIVRDNYGVAHVYADTRYGVFYGYGYAVAQDRLFQMEMARRSTQGLVAEVLGEKYLDHDKSTRMGFSPESIRKQLNALPQQDKDIFEGYVAGFNAWVTNIQQSPETLLPREFVDFDFEPQPWTSYDLAMVFVGTMANRYGDFNTELDNLHILSELTKQHGMDDAQAIFDHLNPRITDDAPTSISSKDWNAGAARRLVSAGITHSAPSHQVSWAVFSGFSNCWVLGPQKSTNANAILVNGPQFGWFSPSYVYGIGLHGGGIDVVGNTPFAYPILLFGHNGHIAWGSTWGAGDIVDIYRESLDPNDHSRYQYKDDYAHFDVRTEMIRVREKDPVEITVRRSVHGPIVHWDLDNGIAYAKKRAWDGVELQSLLAWLNSTLTDNYADWIDQAEKAALNINWYYADRDGNIGYSFVGHYPERHESHDNRFPVSGDGQYDWKGRQSFLHNPKALNPKSGFVANWNNKPAPGVLNPDEYWYSWSSADRVDFLQEAISNRDSFTPDQAWDLIVTSSYADVIAPYFLEWIAQAAEASKDRRLLAASELLNRWNRLSQDTNNDGFFDEPQTTLFRRFVANLQERVLADDLGSVYPMFAYLGYPTEGNPTAAGTNIQTGTKTLVEALEGSLSFDFLNGASRNDIINEVMAQTMDQLSARYGADPGSWRLKVPTRPYSTDNFLGVPQTTPTFGFVGPIEQNRGTENNMVVLREDNIVAYDVTPPGQSGFVASDGTKSPHFDDQLEMYNTFNRKRIWFYPNEVERNQVSQTLLTY